MPLSVRIRGGLHVFGLVEGRITNYIVLQTTRHFEFVPTSFVYFLRDEIVRQSGLYAALWIDFIAIYDTAGMEHIMGLVMNKLGLAIFAVMPESVQNESFPRIGMKKNGEVQKHEMFSFP